LHKAIATSIPYKEALGARIDDFPKYSGWSDHEYRNVATNAQKLHCVYVMQSDVKKGNVIRGKRGSLIKRSKLEQSFFYGRRGTRGQSHDQRRLERCLESLHSRRLQLRVTKSLQTFRVLKCTSVSHVFTVIARM